MSHNIKTTNENRVDLQVSSGNQVTSNKVQLVPFTTIVETIKTGTNGLIEKIEKIRACQNDEEKRRLKKKLLPYFSMGTFKNGKRNNVALQSINHIILDLDHLGDATTVSEMKKKLSEDNHVFCCFTSPSGDGLKVVYQLDQTITDHTEYSKIYEYNATTISKQYGFETDKTSDSARACFMSFDPEIYINPGSTPLSISCPHIPSGRKNKLLHTLTGTTKGHRNTNAAKWVGFYMNKGFDQELTIEHLKLWNQNNKPPLPDDEITKLVVGMYERYGNKPLELPFDIIEKNGGYYKRTNHNETLLATFTIEPKELLVLPDSDCLRCIIHSSKELTYPDTLIENSDWHTKQKFLKSVGHMDCTFHGSDADVQALCKYVDQKIQIRNTGSKIIGLITKNEPTWVTKQLNITKDGIANPQTIVAYDKGKSAFYHGIKYEQLQDEEYNNLLKGVYRDIFSINEQTVIVPWLAWLFATPVKPILIKHVGGFPEVFVHGGQGNGKTSTCRMLKRLVGYTDPKPHSAKERQFPMLKLLSSTNAIPVFLDEFKASLMSQDQVNTVYAFMNKIYSGEIETKGRPDQTVEEYELIAPLCVMGEWNISLPSISERILMVRFKETVKRNREMQEAFQRVSRLPLEGFMMGYLPYLLKQDIPKLFDESQKIVKDHFGDKVIAPRIVNNLSAMVMGINLIRSFGTSNNVDVPVIRIPDILNHQLKEITGSDLGFVRSAVDMLIEELSRMAMKERPGEHGFDCKIRVNVDYKEISVTDNQGKQIEALAVNFKKIFPDFKQYAKQTDYEGDRLDEKSYTAMFEECSYVYSKSHPVALQDKTVRCLIIDIEKAIEAGIDLAGFGII